MNRKRQAKGPAYKIGLVAALSMMIGSVVGVGVFIKNNGTFRNNYGNPTAILVAWILAALISLLTALSYIEISTSRRDKSGLAGWSELYCGKKFGRWIRVIQPTFYFGVFVPCLSFYAGEMLLLIIDNNANQLVNDSLGPHSSITLVLFIGMIFYMLLVTMNYLSTKWSGRFQTAALMIKLVPLIAVMIMGAIVVARNPNFSLFADPTGGNNQYDYRNDASGNPQQLATITTTMSVQGVLVSLPAILFEFDSFANVGNLASELKHPRRYMSILYSAGMILITIIYLLITLAQIAVGEGRSWNAFGTKIMQGVFGYDEVGAKAFSQIIQEIFNVFLLVSITGVVNGYTAASLRANTSMVQEDIIVGSQWYKRRFPNPITAGFAMTLTIYVTWFLVLGAISIGIGNDSLFDGISNFPILFFFALYGTIPFVGWIRRLRQKNIRFSEEHSPTRFFMWVAPIAGIGCYFAVAYQAIYAFFIGAIVDSNAGIEFTAWGAFVIPQGTLFAVASTQSAAMPQYVAGIVFFVMLIVFLAIPGLNAIAKKGASRIERRHVAARTAAVVK